MKKKIYKCKYCEFETTVSNAIGGHISWCKLNPNLDNDSRREVLSQKSQSYVHSDIIKLKISENKINYLKNNPDKVPYLINHSSKKSWPERIFENALNKHNITGWIYNYRNSIYQYDFAFPELNIDVEIDGSTHLTEKVKKIDKRRDEYSRSEGWTVVRFTAKEVKHNLDDCIDKLKDLINYKTMALSLTRV